MLFKPIKSEALVIIANWILWISYAPGYKKIIFKTIHKKLHHNKVCVQKQMAEERENIEIDFNLDEHTEIDILLLKKVNNHENAVLVPQFTGELTDEESETISAEDLPDLPPKLAFVDEGHIKTITLHDARNFVCKTCGMGFKR